MNNFIPEVEAIGVTNRTEDNMHILFLDYDYVHPSVIRKDLNYLLSVGLSTFFIFQTGLNNHHVVSFTKMPFRSIKELAKHTHEDKRHYNIPETHSRRSTVLRISGKYDLTTHKRVREPPSFVALYPSEGANNSTEISSAHYNLYKSLFNLPDISFDKEDHLNYVEIVKFQTLKGGK